jgi:hypothetical protein
VGGDEHLSTGWERDVPIEDSLLRRFLFHNGDLCTAFALSGGGRALETDEFIVADLGRSAGYWNGATLLAPPADWDGVLSRVEAFLAGGRGNAVLFSAWPTPDLRSRGWTLVGHPPFLARPPAALVAPPDAPDVDLRLVRTEAELAEWERVAIEGYPLPELIPVRTGCIATPTLLDDPRLKLWIVCDDGVAVSAAASFVSRGIGSLALGVTQPEARRHGHWRALAVTRLRDTPDLWMTGIFSDYSRPSAERVGFVPLMRLTLWILDRGGGAG